MKLTLTIFLCFISASLFAQIDVSKPEIDIPAIEADSTNTTAILKAPDLIKPKDDELAFKVNKITDTMTLGELPKKEFSMIKDNKFLDNNERFQKKFDKESVKLSSNPEMVALINQFKKDQYFGDFNSKGKTVNILCRDHQFVDGDVIRVFVNGDVVQPNISLIGSYKSFDIILAEGINKIEFQALNQGSSGPNTAEFIVYDDNENLISSNMWNLATGYKASIIIVKE